GDFNGDGVVNTGDLAILAGVFGFDNSAVTSPAALAAVPEPTTLALAGLGLAALAVRRKRA
ncbi:MAG: PEP-CTERM sorting domain-containing protein, partial [Planctomycetota bacterium]